MNQMNNVDRFQKILKLRTIFKSLSQLSWNIAQLEKRYPVDALTNEEIDGLYHAYVDYGKWLKKINNELKGELNVKKK